MKGETSYAIEFSPSGFNCFGGSFSAVKFRHAPPRRASFSSVVAGDSYHRGRLHADESRKEVNYLKGHNKLALDRLTACPAIDALNTARSMEQDADL
jgi:hypothetical protein